MVQFTECLKSISDKREKYRRQKKERDRSQRMVVHNWLQAADCASDQEKYTQERLSDPETGGWILQVKSVSDWCNPSIACPPVLWLTGEPGAGKTILASRVLDELRRSSSPVVVFFYCNQEDGQKNSVRSIARSLLSQLLPHNKALLPILYNCAAASKAGSVPPPFLGGELLGLALRSIPCVYIVLDGMDQCPADPAMSTLASWLTSEVQLINNVFGTARCLLVGQYSWISNQPPKDSTVVEVSISNNTADIRSYCDSRSQDWIKFFGISDQHRRNLVEYIVGSAAGNFRLARFVMEHLCSQSSRLDFNRESKPAVIPKDLSQAYGVPSIFSVSDTDISISRYYRTIWVIVLLNGARGKVAKALLGWLVLAKRPLHWHEILGALSINIVTKTIVFLDRQSALALKELCSPIVKVRSDGTVELVDKLMRMLMLDKRPIVQKEEAYTQLRQCLVYLSHPSCSLRGDDNDLRANIRAGHYASFDYAITHWASHLVDYLVHLEAYSPEAIQVVENDIADFLRSHALEEPEDYPVNQYTKRRLRPFWDKPFYSRLARTFEYWTSETARQRSDIVRIIGLSRIIPTIRSEIEAVALDDKEALQPFHGDNIWRCNRLNCKFFYKGFTDPRQRDEHLQEHERDVFCNVLGCPFSQVGFTSRIDLEAHKLESHQASSVSARPPAHPDPASIDVVSACQTGNLAEVQAWVKQFKPEEIDAKLFPKVQEGEQGGSNAIRAAISSKQSAILTFLLKQTSSPGRYMVDALQIACRMKDYSPLCSILRISEITPDWSPAAEDLMLIWVKQMLNLDDYRAQDLIIYIHSHGWRLRYQWVDTAAEYGSVVSLKYLLDSVCSMTRTDILMTTAATHGRIEACELLVNKGLWSPDKSLTEESLEKAATTGDDQIMHLVLGENASSESNQRFFRISKLFSAAHSGDADTVNITLQYPDLPLNLADHAGCTALHHAAARGHSKVVSLLVASGREIALNARVPEYRGVKRATAFGLAVFGQHVEVVKSLLRCKDIDIKDPFEVPEQNPPLSDAKSYGNDEIDDAIAKHQAQQHTLAAREDTTSQETTSTPEDNAGPDPRYLMKNLLNCEFFFSCFSLSPATD
ncbi:hypothetical protein BJX64DRAFT_295359 [Aspergillus heterothallicus]